MAKSQITIGKCTEYQDREHHNVRVKEIKEIRDQGLEHEQKQIIHIDVGYKNKNIKVHLGFSEETNDRNAKLFYDSLKKIYMEKTKIVL